MERDIEIENIESDMDQI
jgi:hypothetical protein